VEWQLAFLSAVKSSGLKKGIVPIMTKSVSRKLSFGGRPSLLMAGLMAAALPAMINVLNAPVIWAQAVAPAPASEVHARGDIAGDWQGTLQAQKSLRLILKITKTDKGWSGTMYSIDQGAQPIKVTSVALDGSTFKFKVDLIGGSYQGTLSADGNSVAGTWTQGPTPQPLTLVRATKETAWEIPVPPPPPKLMAADADPSFEVATIKPNDSGASQMQGLNVRGRNFTTRNSSLGDLISFAYEVQAKQVVGGPDWLDKYRFDIDAVPDQEGVPNPAQLRIMIKKLLADRFKLTFHHEKRELSAYVLTVGKNGQKLTPTELKGPLPGLGFRTGTGGVTLMVRNGTVPDFTGFLQTLVLDRPVVDQTGLAGKFDFSFTFTPDDSQFNGHPPPLPAKTDGAEASPGLFEAIQQQLGLKLEAQKTPVDVIAIDHVEKPSAN
jgi:uncharacterized protein (TIGR03435 family)